MPEATPNSHTAALEAQGTPSSGVFSRRVRILSWAALPFFAVVYFAVLSSPLDFKSKLVVLELLYCAPILATVGMSLVARDRTHGQEARFWGYLATANAILFLCEVLLVFWVFALDPSGPPRVSPPFHLLHGLAAVCFIGLLVAMTRFASAPRPVTMRWALDLSALSLVTAVVLLEVYVRPVMEPAGASVAEMLLGVMYPLFGMLMLFGTLGNVVGFKVDRWRSWDVLVTISLTVYAIAISLWPLWFGTAASGSRNYERGVLDLIQFSGHWLLMAAALYRLTEIDGWEITPLPRPHSSKRWVAFVVPTILLLAVPAVAGLVASGRAVGAWAAIYVAAATLLVMAVLARSILINLENGALFHQSIVDPLTGLHNHRFFQDRLELEVQQAKRFGRNLAVVVLDIDDFSAFNARHGHAEGDKLLASLGKLLLEACGPARVVARLGTDDFGVIIPESDRLAATVSARRLLDIVAIEAGSAPGSLTASAGVSVYPEDAPDASMLFRRARAALFSAQRSGSGRVFCFDEDEPDTSADERLARLERRGHIASVRALIAAVDARDEATKAHAHSVATLASAVARRMGLAEQEVMRVEASALLHDVGLIAVTPEDGSPLSRSSELDEVRRHALASQRILGAAGLEDLVPIVRSHHEWWDGSGYPDGLAEYEIPIEARILCACDAYDTMIGSRSVRGRVSQVQALDEIASSAGRQFDPNVVAALRGVLASHELPPLLLFAEEPAIAAS